MVLSWGPGTAREQRGPQYDLKLLKIRQNKYENIIKTTTNQDILGGWLNTFFLQKGSDIFANVIWFDI